MSPLLIAIVPAGSGGIVCFDCRWWKPTGVDEFGSYTGECRVHAPVLFRKDAFAIWPSTANDDWCGEAVAK